MKIIGGRDYYDGAGYGVDESIVFVRNETVLKDSPIGETLDKSFLYDANVPERMGFVIVAGVVYPFYRGTKKLGSSEFEDYWVYDKISAERAIDETVGYFGHVFPKQTGALSRLSRFNPRSAIFGFFDYYQKHGESFKDWLIANKITTAIAERSIEHRKFVIIANTAQLGRRHFYKKMPPAEIHMTIANWVGGVLPAGNNPMIELSDKSRIRKAGFDVKSSFRNMPRS